MGRVEVTLLDEDAMPLSIGIGVWNEAERFVALEEVAEPGALLDHLFGRGEQAVMAELGGHLLTGNLETEWGDSGRLWVVRLDERVGAAAPATGDAMVEQLLSPVESAHRISESVPAR